MPPRFAFMTDQLKKYLFEDRTVRVQAVRLADTWSEAQSHHQYPPAVRKLLGELVAAAALLARRRACSSR